MEWTQRNKTSRRSQDEKLTHFEAMDKKAMNQNHNKRFGRRVEDVFSSARPRESCKVASDKPTNSFWEQSTYSNEQEFFSKAYDGGAKTHFSTRRKPFFIPQSADRSFQKGANVRNRYESGYRRNQKVIVCKRPVQNKKDVDWSNVPRIVFYYLVNTMTIDYLWQLRFVCKKWRSSIDAEVEVLRIGDGSEFFNSSLYGRFDFLRSLTILKGPKLDSTERKRYFCSRHLKVLRFERFLGISTSAVESLLEGQEEELEELSFVFCHVQDASLVPIRNMKALKKLDITGTKITDRTLRDLCHQLTGLQDLSLANCRSLSERCFEILGETLMELEALDMSKNPHLFFNDFQSLDGLKKLKQLKMNNCYPSDEGVLQIAQNTSLSSFEMTFDPEQEPSLSYFSDIRRPIGIHELIINVRTDGFIEPIIAAIGALDKLDSLALKGCTISGRQLRHFCSMMTSARNLVSLAILPTKCYDSITFIPEITFLQPNLTELRFPNWHGIKYHFLEEITLSCPELRILHIGQCSKLTDACMKQLLRLPCLEELDISYCSQLTHKGIGGLQRAPALKRLHMKCLQLVEDSGVYGLKKSQTIEELDVSDCKSLSFNGLEALVLMPNLQILVAQDFPFLQSSDVLSLYRRAANPKLKIRWLDQ